MRVLRGVLLCFALIASALPAYATPPNFNGNLTAQGKPWYDVQAYGAKCDGSTDDSAAILAANTAASNAGGTLYFPSGLNCYYNSATPIVKSTTESVYGVGATLTGGASTTDAFQIAGGSSANHVFSTANLPAIVNFTNAGIHFMPGAIQANIYFSLIKCSATTGGIGIEFESNATNGLGDISVTGTSIYNCQTGVEMMQASSSDSAQGILVNVLFVNGDKYGLYFNTSSGTTINPGLVAYNTFNLAAVDCGNLTGSVGVYGSANYNVAAGNDVNAYQYFDLCTTMINLQGGGTVTNQIPQAFITNGASGHSPVFYVPQISVIGRRSASDGSTPPPSSMDSNAIGGLGVEWNYSNGSAEMDLFNTYVAGTPSKSFNFYQSTTGAPTLLGSIGPSWTTTGDLNVGGNIATTTTGKTIKVLGAFLESCNWGPNPSCVPATQNGATFGWNYTSGSGESDWVSLFNGASTAATPAHSFYEYESGTLTRLASIYQDGHFAATAHNLCSASSGVPCNVPGVPGCSMSSATTCSVTETVPSGSTCTATYDHGTGVPVTALLPAEVGLSGTTLTLYATASSAQTASVGFDVTCL